MGVYLNARATQRFLHLVLADDKHALRFDVSLEHLDPVNAQDFFCNKDAGVSRLESDTGFVAVRGNPESLLCIATPDANPERFP